ncbi:MAG TPA: protein-glutamate O-methyltransferase CheR [Oligoflexus sp.]|uniref:CheR family methyltransferase n=1 Tax=Oligoflexus sp. TaxID=1971216 RepID=UPI002D3EA2E6|nr:protein-glutamate O-methyltransferase CheR [Oligoflexus sp.]HYX38178.1 protein-glutamate O-methyltransferase CheR [Oligoflexus sp.]
MSDAKDFPSAEFFHRLSADENGYRKLADWLKTTTGIHMPPTPKNFTLMASRLSKVMIRLGLRTYAELHRNLLDGDPSVQKAFIEALTTNKTEFFREAHHFEILPRIVENIVQHKTELRLWCAAASRGHEPYSILMTLLESGFNLQTHRLKFLATDIDQTVLEAASKGVYRADELMDVSSSLRSKYMVKLRDTAAGERWKFRDELRNLITFAGFNLVGFPYGFQHKFDIIFCRNVLIYFDPKTVLKVKTHLAEALAADGYLFIGHSETGASRVPTLQTMEAAVFKKLQEAS